ncbi:hypothetical protein AAFN60_11000 [Roseibacillus persicicus]|uniref:Uncharacterized protein n=1 Tax=Roseibacillus persicicus TaxID=454148 RepID=A0A918TK52_9BACT|nr:hypothetical protein [Roseibacillus persicicus]GHC51759.1 hypothetical protein GCM10007100_17510 [Roseibacillus persicicus]
MFFDDLGKKFQKLENTPAPGAKEGGRENFFQSEQPADFERGELGDERMNGAF